MVSFNKEDVAGCLSAVNSDTLRPVEYAKRDRHFCQIACEEGIGSNEYPDVFQYFKSCITLSTIYLANYCVLVC